MAKLAVSTLLLAAVLVTSYALPVQSGIVVNPDKVKDGVTVPYTTATPQPEDPSTVKPKLVDVCPEPKTPPKIVNNVNPVSNICVRNSHSSSLHYLANCEIPALLSLSVCCL